MTKLSRHINLHDLLLGFAPLEGRANPSITGLSLDCRQLQPDEAFVALAGRECHGMDFFDAALAAGAAAVICDDQAAVPTACSVPVIVVPALAERLPELARRFWGDPAGMDLVAVTGTNGKSSVAWLLAQALGGAMIGTLGVGRPGAHQATTHTTPDVLSLHRMLAGLRNDGIQTVVMEASSHALDQQRLGGLAFSSVIFTTLGHDHLDYHVNPEAYGAAKAGLFRDYPSQRQLINVDDAFGQKLAAELSNSPGLVRYALGSNAPAAVKGQLINAGAEGLHGTINLDGKVLEVRSRLIGRVNFYNLLVVAAELNARGVEFAEIARRVAGLDPVPGRMQPVAGGDGRCVIIDYAHTPDALENALNSLSELGGSRLLCVFGCGGDRDRAKRPRMGRIAESLADVVILTDDNPRHESSLAIIREIQAGMRHPERCLVIPDRAEAIERALELAATDDLVLIAGKGHESEQVIGNQRHAFSDEAVVRGLLEIAA